MLSKCCRWCCGCRIVCLGLDSCRNLQFGHHIVHISHPDIFCHIPSSQLCQFFKPHQLLPNTCHVVPNSLCTCVHHPTGFIIFAPLANLGIFLIIYCVFIIHLIIASWKLAQTVSDRSPDFQKCFFRLCGYRSCLFIISCFFRLLNNLYYSILTFRSCQSSSSIHIIIDPFHLHFIAWNVGSLSFHRQMLLFKSYPPHCSQWSDTSCVQAALDFILLMMLLCESSCWVAIFAHRKWQTFHILSIDRGTLCWLCCLTRCWLLQDVDCMEASWVHHLKVRMFD